MHTFYLLSVAELKKNLFRPSWHLMSTANSRRAGCWKILCVLIFVTQICQLTGSLKILSSCNKLYRHHCVLSLDSESANDQVLNFSWIQKFQIFKFHFIYFQFFYCSGINISTAFYELNSRPIRYRLVNKLIKRLVAHFVGCFRNFDSVLRGM